MKKVTGLNNREYKWNLSDCRILNDETRPRSKYHVFARSIISSIFHSYIVLEEVPLPGSGKRASMLYLDFFIPNLDIAIEVHGEQHYNFVQFFHKTKVNFLKSQIRDINKEKWCELNNIKLITLKYSEMESWREQIVRCSVDSE
jgi:hypothetical protein